MGRTRSDAEHRLREQLERMSHRTTTIHRLLDEIAAPLDPTGWLIVRTLQRHGAMRSSELAELTHLSRPAVSRCLGALERAGLVVDDPDPEDGRASLVRVTRAGDRHVRKVVALSHERIGQITDGFSVVELETLGRLLGRLNDNADGVALEPSRYRMETQP